MMIHFGEKDRFVVTGASSGIGAAIALRLNELGGTVIAVARSEEKLAKIKQSASNNGRFIITPKDLSHNMDDFPNWFANIADQHGRLSGLVHSAGIQQITPLKAMSLEASKKMFDINFFSAVFLSKAFCHKKVVHPDGGSIVLISSIASIIGESGIVNYSASKGAINSAVRSMAVEFSRQKIRVNSVLPGFVLTEMIDKWSTVYTKEYIEKLDKEYPLGIGKPEDVCDTVCFLLSQSAKWITGQGIVVDGGGSL